MKEHRGEIGSCFIEDMVDHRTWLGRFRIVLCSIICAFSA